MLIERSAGPQTTSLSAHVDSGEDSVGIRVAIMTSPDGLGGSSKERPSAVEEYEA